MATGDDRQAFLVTLSGALDRLSDPMEIQAAASRILGEHLEASRVLYIHVGATGGAASVDRGRGRAGRRDRRAHLGGGGACACDACATHADGRMNARAARECALDRAKAGEASVIHSNMGILGFADIDAEALQANDERVAREFDARRG